MGKKKNISKFLFFFSFFFLIISFILNRDFEYTKENVFSWMSRLNDNEEQSGAFSSVKNNFFIIFFNTHVFFSLGWLNKKTRETSETSERRSQKRQKLF